MYPAADRGLRRAAGMLSEPPDELAKWPIRAYGTVRPKARMELFAATGELASAAELTKSV